MCIYPGSWWSLTSFSAPTKASDVIISPMRTRLLSAGSCAFLLPSVSQCDYVQDVGSSRQASYKYVIVGCGVAGQEAFRTIRAKDRVSPTLLIDPES